MTNVDGAGSAKRRRERRLRMWWRHEQQSVRAAVAAALHHSRDVGPRTTHDALRGQKPAAVETETEFFQMSEGDSVGETVGMYGARPVLLMLRKSRLLVCSSRHMNECCNGVNKLASCMGWWNRWWMFPHTCLRIPSWPSTSLRNSSCLRRSMWMTAATYPTNSTMTTSCRLASGLASGP